MDEADIRAALADLPGWELGTNEIAKEFRFDGFLDAIKFVNAVAERAEAANHHPDIDIRYNRVHLTLSTHSEGGVTTKDLALAREVNALATSAS